MENRLARFLGKNRNPENPLNSKPQEKSHLRNLEDDLKANIQHSIDSLFPHPNINGRELKNPELYWGDYMPELSKDFPELAEYEALFVMIDQFTYSNYFQILLHFGVGSITMKFYPNNGKSTTETTYTNKIEEKITQSSGSEDVLSNVLRLTRIKEGFDYYNAIRDHRIKHGVTPIQEGSDD